MAVPEPFTEYHNTPNKSVRQNVPRKGVVLHHAAMTNLDELIRLEMGAKEVSSNSTCKDSRLPEMFDTDGPWRAWSLSDAYWDSALRSVETCNESTIGWTVSAASHRSLAKVVAYWAQKDGFYPHRNGDPKTWTVLGHREVYTIHGGSYSTACPGGLDLNLVTRLAQEILKNNNTEGADVAHYKRFQNNQKYTIGTTWQKMPTVKGTTNTNLASGTGGMGLYDMTLNFYLTGLYEDGQIEGKLVLDPTSSDPSSGYVFTIEGNATGNVKAAIPAIMNVQSAATLRLELRTVAGKSKPVVALWGADVKNLTVA